MAQAFDLAGITNTVGCPVPCKKSKGQGTLEPNFRPPFERISDAQIPLTRQNNRVAVDFRSPERLSDNRTMSYGPESQETRRNR